MGGSPRRIRLDRLRRHGAQGRQDVLHVLHHFIEGPGPWRGKAGLHGIGDQRVKRFPVTPGIDDDDRFIVHSELFPGDDFEGLVQRAHTAGQGDKAVGQFEHALFTAMHAVDDLQIGDMGMAVFQILQIVGNDADYLAADGQRAVGNGPHETNSAAAKHKSDAGRAY